MYALSGLASETSEAAQPQNRCANVYNLRFVTITFTTLSSLRTRNVGVAELSGRQPDRRPPSRDPLSGKPGAKKWSPGRGFTPARKPGTKKWSQCADPSSYALTNRTTPLMGVALIG